MFLHGHVILMGDFSDVKAESPVGAMSIFLADLIKRLNKMYPQDSIKRKLSFYQYEPPHGKTNNLHRRKQRRRSASR